MKIYRLETKKDYYALMVELEDKGVEWITGKKPTDVENWDNHKEDTCVCLEKNFISYSEIGFYEEVYPDVHIQKYKAKQKYRDGEYVSVPKKTLSQAINEVLISDDKRKVVVPQYVAKWLETHKETSDGDDYTESDALADTIHFTIHGLFADYPETNSDVQLRKPVLKWLSNDRMNYFTLVDAVRYGYDTEEEKKYLWKKSRKYLAEFEDDQYLFLDENIITTVSDTSKATEHSLMELENELDKADLEKFERIDPNQFII